MSTKAISSSSLGEAPFESVGGGGARLQCGAKTKILKAGKRLTPVCMFSAFSLLNFNGAGPSILSITCHVCHVRIHDCFFWHSFWKARQHARESLPHQNHVWSPSFWLFFSAGHRSILPRFLCVPLQGSWDLESCPLSFDRKISMCPSFEDHYFEDGGPLLGTHSDQYVQNLTSLRLTLPPIMETERRLLKD